MTALYITIDILLILIIIGIAVAVIYFWNKKNELNVGSLSEFRNNSIYEKSYEDQKKKAHIEEIAISEPEDISESETEKISFETVFFEEGYGGEGEKHNEN